MANVLVMLLLVVVSLLAPTSGQPSGDLCQNVRCLPGDVCRVIQACNSPVCPPRPLCVPCVPRGIDHVCNRNNYIYTVLVGQQTQPRALLERKCVPYHPNSCPYGSACVPDGAGSGNCCYRRPPPGLPAINRDPVCPVLGKPGFCPLVPPYIPPHCPPPVNYCRNDYDCPGILKCCRTECGGYDCNIYQ